MRRVIILAILIALVGLLTSCPEPVTPVAYTRFDAPGSQYVYYSSDMYGTIRGQIEVYENEAAAEDTSNALLKFSFTRCLGADTLEGERYTLVDVTSVADLSVMIKTSGSLYGADKDIYLNGTKLVHDNKFNGGSSITLSFKNLDDDLLRTNPNGQITPANVNYLEYK